ncbi:phosphonate ABC transporter, permease protein PhnE [uncultured Roseobacter sp.]|uniref:phosphonate ABC transporter, permease protein PhnE n=1 Tax=uncultured Roseobacter sp. TaxID=114847 RepID=UPI00261AF648|nr:phosphonate ABC transporter, permease protein PhnE [uncultured Roseobacter sp.]
MADTTFQAGSLSEMQTGYARLIRTRRMWNGAMLALFIALLVAGFMTADARNAGGFWNGIDNVFDFPVEVIDEAWEKSHLLPGHFAKYFPSLVETINIAAAATLVGVMVGAILSLLSTRGLARWPSLVGLFRRVSDILRAIPEIVIALVLIFVLGAGPVPAMIAIALHTAGAIGKLYSEVNENASLKPVEGLASVGANWSQRMLLGIVPQVAPNYLSYALLRFEINIRASAILGFVGAGGIGYDLKNTMSWGQGKFDEAAAIFILLFAAIVLFDQLSSYARHRLTTGART